MMMANLFDLISEFISKILYGLLMRFVVIYRKVELGKGCTFIGFVKFKKGRKNIIRIGNNCKFLSKMNSNLIGINRNCIVSSIGANGSILEIGDNCGFSGTVISCFEHIVLEDAVRCGANTLITDSDWHLDDPRTSPPQPVHIKRNVWLGVNVTVLKGVTIGENTIIGAGSVVTKDIPANVIACGSPCVVIKYMGK